MNGAASFINLAREDLEVAKKLLIEHPRSAAFHIEQAAEKLLKAVLDAEGIVSPNSINHQLGQLAGLLPDGHIWRADLMAFDEYTPYGTSTRYPRPGGRMPDVPSAVDLQAATETIASLVSEISDWCKEKQPNSSKPKA